jgi:hypothetical protein
LAQRVVSEIDNKPTPLLLARRVFYLGHLNLHRTWDMALLEDERRVRRGYGAQNVTILRHIAFNLLSNEKSQKIGIKNRKLLVGWDPNFLLKVLGF